MGLPCERDQVVFAQRREVDVANQHHLLVALVEDGGQHLGRIPPEALHRLLVGARNPLGGLAQAFPVGVLTDTDQQLADGTSDPLMVERTDRPWPEVRPTPFGVGDAVIADAAIADAAIAVGIRRSRRRVPGGCETVVGRQRRPLSSSFGNVGGAHGLEIRGAGDVGSVGVGPVPASSCGVLEESSDET